jgi:3-deoxy-7-phosphoheptulonate synthase
MIITLKDNVTKDQLKEIEKKAKELGFIPEVSKGKEKTLILVKGEQAILSRDVFEAYEAVELITQISEPFKLVSKHWKEKTIVDVEGEKIGDKKLVFMAGPCSVESPETMLEIAKQVKALGATFFRGGAFKPRTSPYAFQGLGVEGLKILNQVYKETGLKIVTEVMDSSQIEPVEKYAHMIQIGARNMQNFELLKACGKSSLPVLLKRGFSNTIKEFLMSAEYIASEGNENIILCERGIRTFSDYTRFTLDVACVPVTKKLTHLPIIVDPSHPAGKRDLVEALSLASLAAGADGLIIEVHNRPEEAKSDGSQTINPAQFKGIIDKAQKMAPIFDREI